MDSLKLGSRCSVSVGIADSSLELLGNSSFSLLSGELEFSEPLSSLGIGEDSLWTILDDLLGWLLVSSSLLPVWVSNDGLMNLLVEILTGLDLVGSEAFLPSGELSIELSWVLLLKCVHVVGNMVSEDMSSVYLGIIFSLGLARSGRLSSLVGGFLDLSSLISWESFGGMWDIDSTIGSTLHSSKESGSSSSSADSDIEKSLEWSLITNILINVEVLTVDLIVGLVHFAETNLLEQSSSEKKTSAVSSTVVGKTSSHTMALKLGRLRGAKNSISSHGGVDDLADELGASSSDDESVLLGVILIFILEDESLSSVEIGFSLSSSLWLYLHSLVICLVLDHFNK